jgi:hypothetical protein
MAYAKKNKGFSTSGLRQARTLNHPGPLQVHARRMIAPSREIIFSTAALSTAIYSLNSQ